MKPIYVTYYKLIMLLFFNIACGYSQIVNEGMLHISDSTTVYFEHNFTNKKGGTITNNGTLYLNNELKNEGLIKSETGSVFFKKPISPKLHIAKKEIDEEVFKVLIHQNERLTYIGQDIRMFHINAEIGNDNGTEAKNDNIFFIRKNGSDIIATKKNNNSISGKVELAKNDFIEIWEQRLISNDSTIQDITLSINLSD